jgi:hypothetical protein
MSFLLPVDLSPDSCIDPRMCVALVSFSKVLFYQWCFGLRLSKQTIINRQYPIKTNHTFLEIVAVNGLEQIVDFPTRKDNTLDLMLLSHPAYKLRCKPLPSIGNSDHALSYELFASG